MMAYDETLLPKVPKVHDERGYHTYQKSMISHDDYVENSLQLLIKGAGQFDAPISIMSVGAGSGYYEKRLCVESGLKVDYIFAVEPNKCFEKELSENLKDSGAHFDIDQREFSEKFESKMLFDLVIFQQSLYYIEDPISALKQAKSMLVENGRIMILIQGELAPSRRWSLLLMKHLKGDIKLPHLLAAPELLTGLSNANIEHEVIEERPIDVDIDDFVRKSGTCIQRYSYVNQATQVEFKKLSDRVQEILHDFIQKSSSLDVHSKRYKYTTYVVLMIIPWTRGVGI